MSASDLPRRYDLSLNALDPSSRKWVDDDATFYAPSGVDGRKVVLALMGLCIAAPIVYGYWVNGLAPYQTLDPSSYGVASVVLTLASAFLGVIAWLFFTIFREKGWRTALHDFYLVQQKGSRLRAYPLVNLNDVTLHRRTGMNGGIVRIELLHAKLDVQIGFDDELESFSTRVLTRAKELQGLRNQGQLATARGRDFVPATSQSGKNPGLPPALQYAIAAGIAAIQFQGYFRLVALPANERKLDDHAWKATGYYGNELTNTRDYLRKYPAGRHAEEAHARIKSAFDAAISSFDEADDDKRSKAMVALLKRGRELESGVVRVHFASRVELPDVDELELPAAVRKTIADPHRSFDDAKNTARESSVVDELQKAIDQTAARNIIQLVRPEERSTEPTAGVIEVSYTVRDSGSIYKVTSLDSPLGKRKGTDGDAVVERRLLGLEFQWKLAVKLSREQAPVHAFELTSRPAANITTQRDVRYDAITGIPYNGFTADDDYDALAGSAFDSFGSKVATELGVRGWDDETDEPMNDDDAVGLDGNENGEGE